MQSSFTSILILPTATTPARRFLRELAGSTPLIGKHLVAVTGDAIGINDIYRDGALLWNVRDVPIPLVFFAHHNPVGWDADLLPPAGTDDVLLFGRLFEVIFNTVYPEAGTLPGGADELRTRILAQRIVQFEANGDRKEGDEYVVYVRPDISDLGRIGEQAAVEVWRRSRGEKVWRPIETSVPLEAPFPNRTADRLVGGSP